MRQPTKIHSTTKGFQAFPPRRAAVVAEDPQLRSRIIRRHRKSIRSRWRKLSPGGSWPSLCSLTCA